MTAPKPATPMRLAIFQGYLVATKHPDAIGIDARCLAKVEPNADASLQAWADRANAYPRLVEALRRSVNMFGASEKPGHQIAAEKFRALLRELGEAE